MIAAFKNSLAHWPELSHAVCVPHADAECRRLVSPFDQLTDELATRRATEKY